MHHLNTFNFGKHAVRVVQGADGEPCWVAKDVAEVLGYVWNGSAAISHVPEEWKGVRSVLTPRGTQDMATLTEQGLYFFLGRSDKPAALPFQKWVSGSVLPSIRKTGSYGAINPANLSRMDILSMALEAEQKAQALACQVSELAPKAAGLDRIATVTDGSMCLTDGAKHLQIQPKALFAWLQAHGWIYRRAGNKNWIAYQERLKSGLLEHKIKTVPLDDGSERVCEQVLITAKGLARLAAEL